MSVFCERAAHMMLTSCMIYLCLLVCVRLHVSKVHRFKRSKADDMRKVVLDYVTLQIEFNKATEAQWAELVPEIESIQVGKRMGLWMV